MSYNAIMKTKVLVNIYKECIITFDNHLGYRKITQNTRLNEMLAGKSTQSTYLFLVRV